ncbi:MAG: squalene synthase HpnC [Pseudomonadota bacterium]
MPVDHYENFPVASLLLPERLREPVTAIYWFARTADDIADEGDADPPTRLAGLERCRTHLRAIEAGETPADPVFERLARAVRAHELPLAHFHDLLDAFSQDVVKKRYSDFDELLGYCRRSANPVGRLMLHLYDAASEENFRQSDAICSALQLINFWQDVAIDYRKGRIYIPQEDMRRFGVTEAHIRDGIADAAWRALMRFEIERARAMLESGAPLARALPGRIGLELRMIVQGGRRVAEKLAASEGCVFEHRPVLKLPDWPLMLWRALRM